MTATRKGRQVGSGARGSGATAGQARDEAPAHAAGPFEIERHLFYWMTRVMGRRDRQLADELRRFGLRVPEWRVLALACSRQALSIGQAAPDVGIDHTTMSRIVDRMVRGGLLLKLADAADMRITRVAPTAAGQRLMDEVWPVVARLNREALARLPEGSVPLLCLALSTVSQTMEESWLSKGRRKNPPE